MGENTRIEWATHTWNPWFGCTEVSPACDHCYARVLMAERYGRVTWGAGEDRVRTSKANWQLPLRWNRAAAKAGRIDTVFCLSLGDIWDNEVDPMWRREAFDVMRATPSLTYLLLSKRIGNAVKMCDPMAGNPLLPENVALGATMIDQEEWDRDNSKLIEAGRILGARFTFASVEPMLGPINMHDPLCRLTESSSTCPACLGGIDWVIVGGESKSHHSDDVRGFDIEASRDLERQCIKAGMRFFRKQLGALPFEREISDWPNGYPHGDKSVNAVGDGSGRYFIRGLKDKKGGDPSEWPIDLRRRELPEVRT